MNLHVLFTLNVAVHWQVNNNNLVFEKLSNRKGLNIKTFFFKVSIFIIHLLKYWIKMFFHYFVLLTLFVSALLNLFSLFVSLIYLFVCCVPLFVCSVYVYVVWCIDHIRRVLLIKCVWECGVICRLSIDVYLSTW